MDNVVTFSLFLVDGSLTKEEDDKLFEAFKTSIIKEKETITIGMVSFDEGSFYVKDFDIKNKIYELHDFDLHYGEGFENFDNELFDRLLKETKGLTLFHGNPGTGKTTYIRHLIKKLKLNNKNNNILYFPPTMVGSITEPGFINFISEWVSESKGKNYLLIEDAEPLLESRNQSRNIGITNLLNLTDGILNDVLSIQIIATFNTNLKNVDDALLRAERLLARKEFKPLSKDRAINLCKAIGVNEDLVKKEMSLADIYSLKKETKPLTHDVEDEAKRISF
jgi:SpoVK/Ycf46/Vps4 family AAA+-type ATPase